jgi:hypothetical protein
MDHLQEKCKHKLKRMIQSPTLEVVMVIVSLGFNGNFFWDLGFKGLKNL